MAITTWKAILKEQKQNHSLPGSLYVNNDRWVEAWYGLHPLFPGQRTICRARRILAERLGRPLIRSEHAHHKNNNKLDDRSSNITLLTISVHNSLTHTGKKVTAETRQKISHARKGIEFSVEHRQKLVLRTKAINIGKIESIHLSLGRK